MNTTKEYTFEMLPPVTRQVVIIVLFVLLFAASFFAGQILGAVGVYKLDALFGGALLGKQPIYATTLGGVLNYAIMVGLLFCVSSLLDIKPTKALLGIAQKPQWKDIAVALGIVPLYFLTTALAMYVYQHTPGANANQIQEISQVDPRGLLALMVAFFLMVIVAPFVEELLCRGLMFGVFMKYKVQMIVAIVVVSLVFGVAHGQWNVGIDTFIISVYLCIARLITGSIWSGIFVHMFKNGLAFALLFVVGLSKMIG